MIQQKDLMDALSISPKTIIKYKDYGEVFRDKYILYSTPLEWILIICNYIVRPPIGLFLPCLNRCVWWYHAKSSSSSKPEMGGENTACS